MDLKQYCGKDISYFRTRPRPAFFEGLENQKFSLETADRAVVGDVTVVSRPYRFPGGRIDFLFDPTKDAPPQNPEWVWQLNRMYFWRDMSLAYLKTGDEKYARAFEIQVNDWIDATADTPHNNNWGSAWRTIECGLRLMNYWQIAFEVFRKSPSVSDKTLERMIFSMLEQADYTYRNKTGGNWLGMEMCGCCTLASLFPELPVSAELWDMAKKCLEEQVTLQMLPDGMQYELSPDYQSVVFTCGSNLYRLAECAGLQNTLSQKFMNSLEKYAESYLNLMTPHFTQPRTNDCFTMSTSALLAKAAEIFPVRKDFLWAATGGKDGSAPQGSSRNLPYSGFTAMRSGWDQDATYLCFDHGALGNAHMHQDKLNIQLYKGGEELIYDDGGGEYECSVHRSYGVSAYGHNTVLVDRKAQMRSAPKILDKPEPADFVSNDRFDYARAVYDQEFGPFSAYYASPEDRLKVCSLPATHEREVLFVRPDYFCIADTLRSRDGNTHEYTMLLHMDTLNVVPEPALPGAFRAKFGRKYDLLIVPLRPVQETKILSGRLEPYPSGWYVGRNDQHLHKASTLEMTVSGRKDGFFATLLIPVCGDEPLPRIKPDGDCVNVQFRGRTDTIRLHQLTLL